MTFELVNHNMINTHKGRETLPGYLKLIYKYMYSFTLSQEIMSFKVQRCYASHRTNNFFK